MKLARAAFAIVAVASGTHAMGQPATFYDAGEVVVPSAPPSTQESVDLSTIFDFGDGVSPGETLSVKWLRIDLASTVSGSLYLDAACSIFGGSRDVVMAVYNAAGTLVAVDDTTDGRGGNGAALSFGSTAERTPPSLPQLRGQNGATLPAGTYWFAVAAGTGAQVSAGASGWSVSSSESYVLGYGDNDAYLEWYIAFGNTTPLPPPANNDCANATPIGEDVGSTPAFVGSTAGATADGTSPCYVPISGLTYKDVWFSYTPSQSGYAQIVASTPQGEGTTAILTVWDGGCGGAPVRCSGSGNFALVGGSRLLVPVTQGVPVLLSVAMRAGDVGGLRLNVDLLPPACTLVPPPGAISDGEACGEASNDGCNTSGGTFGTIAPGQTIAGTLWTTTNPQIRDRDWFRLTVTEAITAQLTIRGQAAMEAAILGAPQQPGNCSGAQVALARITDSLNPCAPAVQTVVLVPGEYFVAVAQLYADGLSCDSGYNQYLLSLPFTACEQPVVTQNPPANITAPPGGSISLTGAMTADGAVSYTWQWGQVVPNTNPPVVSWTDLNDGEFSDLFSSAQVSGSATGTLTITGIDTPLGSVDGGLRLRLKGEACAPNFTLAARLTVSSACGLSDIAGANQTVGADGTLTADDIIVFLGWFFAGDTRADVAGANQSATPDGNFTADDIIVFLGRYFAGC